MKVKDMVMDIYSMTPMQEGMLFFSMMNKTSHAYTEQISYRLKGSLNVGLVKESLNKLIERHDVLRTAFVYRELDRPVQVVLKERKVNFHFEDLRVNLSEEEKEHHVFAYQEKDKASSFDLERDTLFRVAVLQLTDNDFEIVWSFHHIIMDGWSIGMIIFEFNEFYNSFEDNRSPQLPARKPYKNYIKWLEKKDKIEAGNYWNQYLKGYEQLSTLSLQNISRKSGYYKKEEITLRLNDRVTQKLKAVSEKWGVTLNTVIQALWGVMLAKYNGVNDVVFGAVVSGRPSEIEGVESITGLFINTIPVRVSYDKGEKFADIIKRLHYNSVQSIPYQYHPLASIQSSSLLKQNLLDHIIVFENYLLAEQIEERKGSAMFEISKVSIFEQTNYDLNLIVKPGLSLSFRFDFNTAVYETGFVIKISKQLEHLINQILDKEDATAGSLQLLLNEERDEILKMFNNSAKAYSKHRTIAELFEEQVTKAPQAIAIITEERLISYQELNEESNQLAHYLRHKYKIQSNDLIGIMAERSERMIIAILAIVKSGAAYVPIDPAYPRDRIDYMVNDSGVKALLIATEELPQTPLKSGIILKEIADEVTCQSLENPETINLPEDLVYVIYTSGSTGTPKGVMVKLHPFVNLLEWYIETLDIKATDVNLLVAPISFDLAQKSFFSPLITGGALCLLRNNWDYYHLQDAIEQYKVTIVNCAPAAFYPLIEIAEENSFKQLASINSVVLGGEPIKVAKFQKWKTTRHYKAAIYNTYGPTECTDVVSWYQLTEKDFADFTIPPIGKPVSNTNLFVLDDTLSPIPVGCPGELFSKRILK